MTHSSPASFEKKKKLIEFNLQQFYFSGTLDLVYYYIQLGFCVPCTGVKKCLRTIIYLFAWPVSRFDHPENRKSLIRLEQGARSYVNRGIMSRGAFAVIYGLHLKYYIKDPEVNPTYVFQLIWSITYNTPQLSVSRVRRTYVDTSALKQLQRLFLNSITLATH